MPKTKKYSKKFGGNNETREEKAERMGKELEDEEAAMKKKKEGPSKKSQKKARQRERAADAAAEAATEAALEKAVEERAKKAAAAEAAAAEKAVEERAAEAERRAAAEEAEMEELKKCCDERDRMMAMNKQLQEQLDAYNKEVAARPDTMVSEAASSSSSAQDREPGPNSSAQDSEPEEAWTRIPSSRRMPRAEKSGRFSKRVDLSITEKHQAADKDKLIKFIKIAIDNMLKIDDNVLTQQAIKGNKTMGFIEFSPNILNFPDTGNIGGHITIMPNNVTNENGSHITITLPTTWTPGAGKGGRLHIYRNGTFNVKWYNHYVSDFGPQAARPTPEDFSILNSDNWEKIYNKLTTIENGLPLHVKGVSGGATNGPKSINFGVNCPHCGAIQEGDVNNENSSRTKGQFNKMMQTLREFMNTVNMVLTKNQVRIKNILSQKGGKKTRKQRKQRKQKTKGKKSKARKSKQVKRKTRKYK